MDKYIWGERTPDTIRETGGLDAARGLIIGFAISQVFWLVLAVILVRF